MEGLTVKGVDLMGDTVMAAQDKNGNIWAGVSYFCKALGMSNKQRDNQVTKVQTDKTLKKGTLKFQEGVFDQYNEAVGIRIDFIPIWLAKIPITERMEQDHPDLADKLLQYQLKAKDILAAAFLPEQSISDPDLRISGGTTIRLYKNNQWGILDMGGNLYNLTPDEFSMVAKLIPALDKNGVKQVPLVITTLLGISGRSGKLKYVGTYTCQDNKQ